MSKLHHQDAQAKHEINNAPVFKQPSLKIVRKRMRKRREDRSYCTRPSSFTSPTGNRLQHDEGNTRRYKSPRHKQAVLIYDPQTLDFRSYFFTCLLLAHSCHIQVCCSTDPTARHLSAVSSPHTIPLDIHQIFAPRFKTVRKSTHRLSIFRADYANMSAT